jgi:hypothetical protein
VKVNIFHNDKKIFELIPKSSNGRSPTMNFTIHANHAYFYSGGKLAASKTSVIPHRATIQDEYSDRRIREPFPTERRPSFEEWRDGVDILDAAENGFLDLYNEFNPDPQEPKKKRSRGTDREQRKVVYYYVRDRGYDREHHMRFDDIDVYYWGFLDRLDALKGTDRCFSIEKMYGSDPNTVTSLCIKGKGLPRIMFRILPPSCHVMQHIAKTTKLVVYRGDSIGAFGEAMRIATMKQRFHINDAIKAAILARQEDSCAKCHEPLDDDKEYDHIQPLADGGTDDIANLNALCSPCHAEKTKAERLSSFKDACYSELSADNLEAFVAAPRPQQLVFGDGEEGCLELDSIRSRRNAVENTTVEMPIACLLPEIRF